MDAVQPHPQPDDAQTVVTSRRFFYLTTLFSLLIILALAGFWWWRRYRLQPQQEAQADCGECPNAWWQVWGGSLLSGATGSTAINSPVPGDRSEFVLFPLMIK